MHERGYELGERADPRPERAARLASGRRAGALQLWAAGWLAFANGCGTDRRAQEQAAAQAAFATAAAQDPELADAMGKAIVDIAQREAPGWVKEGKLWRGSLPERGKRDFLIVLHYGHCYRFAGVAADEGADLELRLVDADGVERQRDVTQGPTAILGSLCPDAAAAMRIEARMRHGQGDFAIALLHDPP